MASNGRIMEIADHNDASKSQVYTYDGFYRLAAVTKGTPPTHSATVAGNSNRITASNCDEAENVTDDTRQTYVFDANNKITSMGSGAAAYAYDAQGARVMKTVGGVTTYYFWGHERTSTGWKKFHIYLGREKLVEYNGNTTRFFHGNHLGTSVARTDVNGTQDASWSHYPFGEEWSSTGPSNDQHRFTGHMRNCRSSLLQQPGRTLARGG
ncbi:MAG TPA: hypothetical protein VLV83_10475 [Acidobacteriota bacterium]|nr:hypothetical protein [Acidobacteriota bacterium]